MSASLSLCLIVKNEEMHIHQVLCNAYLYADEIIIIDTGSTDNTKKIAKQYTNHVYDFPWCDDFSAARNFAISKCTKEYIIWLDADDIVLDNDARRIKQLFSSSSLVDIYFAPYYYRYNENDKYVILFRERIFRNSKHIFFAYPVYECLNTSKEVTATIITIPVLHNNVNVNDGKKQSLQRNLSILLQAIRKKKYKEDMRLWWHLANIYGILEQYDISIDTYYIALTKKEENLSPAQLSRLHFELATLLSSFQKDYSEAQKQFEIAMKLYPDWREPFFEYAKLQYKQKNYAAALQAFLQCRKIMLPQDQDVLHHAIYNNQVLDIWLARSYFHLGKLGSAIFYGSNAISLGKRGKE